MLSLKPELIEIVTWNGKLKPTEADKKHHPRPF